MDRIQYVGGSEVAALFGEDPRLTRFGLYHRKKGNIESPDLDDNERVFWGRTLEPAIIKGACEREGWELLDMDVECKSPIDRHGGHIDARVQAEGDVIPLEVKTVDRLIFRSWDGEPPLHYLLQCHAYMGLIQAPRGAVAALIGGNELQVFKYDFRPKTQALIESAIIQFWHDFDHDIEPEPDWSADAETVIALYQSAGEDFVNRDGDGQLLSLAKQYLEAQAAKKMHEARQKEAQAKIYQRLGDAAGAWVDGTKITAKMTADSHVKEHTRKGYRRLTITPPKEPKQEAAE